MDERYIKRPERVKRAMEQLWWSFVDCTINAPEALALHQYVTSLEKAANRTTPDRNAIIEECAKVCDEYAADQWSLYKGRAPYTGSEPGRADSDVQGRSDGADVCASRIRELKTAPTAASSSEATDTERLDWLARTGIAIRNEHTSGRWYLQAPYHTKIACVDDFKRFDTFRAAIDAALSQLQEES